MKRLRLVRKREFWAPTAWGWLLLLAFAVATSLFLIRHVYAFLAPNEPLGARLLVVEGWMSRDELEQARQTFQRGGYARLVTTGGPIESWSDRLGQASYAELAADFLVRSGLPADSVVAVPAPASAQDRTFLNAVKVREWARTAEPALDAFDLFSAGVHARRSWLLYCKAFGPGVRVGILAAEPAGYDPQAWWRSSAGAKSVLSETLSWIWTELCFHPGPAGSQEELWGKPQTSQPGQLRR